VSHISISPLAQMNIVAVSIAPVAMSNFASAWFILWLLSFSLNCGAIIAFCILLCNSVFLISC